MQTIHRECIIHQGEITDNSRTSFPWIYYPMQLFCGKLLIFLETIFCFNVTAPEIYPTVLLTM